MADQKYTVEDILNEYSQKTTDSVQKDTTSIGRMEVHRLLEQTDSAAAQKKAASVKPKPFRRANEQSKINRIKRERRTVSSRPDIETSRLAAFQTLELMREKVSFVNSPAANPQTAPAPKNDRIEGYEGAVRIAPEPEQNATESNNEPKAAPVALKKKITPYQPQIRTMEDSTRAKEEHELKKADKVSKKKKKVRQKENQHPYKWDSIEEQSRQEQEKLQEPAAEVVPEKPVFLDLHHSNADAAEDDDSAETSRLAKEQRQRQRRIAAIHRLRKKRMRMRELEAEDAIASEPIPNNETEIRANIQTLGKAVHTRMLVLLIAFVLSLLLSVAEGVESLQAGLLAMVTERGYALLHLILGGVSFGVSFPTIVNGMKRLFHKKADGDTMAAVPMAAAMLGTLVSLLLPDSLATAEAHLFVPVAVFALLMNCVGKHLILRRAAMHLKTLTETNTHSVLSYVQNEQDAETMTRGIVSDYPVLVSVHKTKRMSDFLRYTYASDIGDRLCERFVPVLLIGAVLVAAAITGIRSTVMPGLALPGFFCSVFSMILSGGCCCGMMLVANLPLFRTAKAMSERGSALLGYQSVDEFYDSNALMVDADTLFTEGSVSVSSMKAFGDLKVQDAVLEAASLTDPTGSILKTAFAKMLDEENQTLLPAESVQFEEEHGLSGWIRNRRVLLGNREMMIAHNIEGLPSMRREEEFSGGDLEKDVLYLSVSGVLGAMFLVEISASNRIKRVLGQFMEEDAALVIRARDSFLTQQRIAKLYALPENRIRIIPQAMQETFDKYAKTTEHVSASMITSGALEDTVQLLLQSRKIRRSATIGAILQSVSVIIGLGIALVYIGLSAYTSVTSEMFLLFQMASCLITTIAVRMK